MILAQRADLGHGNVKKLLFSLSVPTITSQIVNLLYNLVDRVFIGHMQPVETVGKLALTGVGVCLPIIMVISAFASLMAIGGAPRASIVDGAGESERSERIMGNCLTMLLITSFVLTILFEVFAERLLLLFGASENTVGYALDYMRIYALGTVFVQLTLGMNAYITAQGFTTVSMKTVLLGALLNTALDPVFFCAWPRRARCGAGDGDLAGSVGRVGDDIPHGKEDALALKAREPARGREDRVAVYRAGTFPVCDAVDREPHCHLLQCLPPALRRRCGRGCDDGADKCDAVFQYAAPRADAGRTAHRELQFWRAECPARARGVFLPAARLPELFDGDLASC